MSDSDLTPEQDDAVRALLADARHTGPTPPDVVARLDASLAHLIADRDSSERLEMAPVVTLASRRRRTAATLLLAAAAVVVFGVGIGQVLPSDNSSQDSAGSAADAGDSTMSYGDESTSEEQLTAPEASRSLAGDAAEPTEKELDADDQARESAPVPTNPSPPALEGDATNLKAQVRRLQRTSPYASYAVAPDCVPSEAAPGLEVAVTYDDQPAALVFRDPDAGAQRVDIFICGEPAATRTLTLKAR